MIVAWYDDARFYGLGEPTPEKGIDISWDHSSAVVVGIPVMRNQGKSREETIITVNGKIAIRLGYVPVMVE